MVATVAAGLYMGISGSRVLPVQPRLQGSFVWDILDFLVNAILFVLIGLQLRAVVGGLGGHSPAAVAGYAAGVVAVVVGSRLVWFFTVRSHSPSLWRYRCRPPAGRSRNAIPSISSPSR